MFSIKTLEEKLNLRLAKSDKTIYEHNNELLAALKTLSRLGYLNDRYYELLEKCCKYHDYGKINDEFQRRVSSSKRLKFDEHKEVAHNVLSLCFIYEEDFDSIEDYYLVCFAVLNHHHYVDNFAEARNKEELIQQFIELHGGDEIEPRLLKKLQKFKKERNAEALLLKGLLHKCDYAASGSYEIEYPNNFLMDSLNQNLLPQFEDGWNELQQFCIKNTDENLIVVANTGMGKTEAGLLWIGDHKGFFVLPLRTAINAIYDRIAGQRKDENNKAKGVLQGEKLAERVSLLHSDTVSYYLDKLVTEENEIIKYAERGGKLSMPLTVTTLDQLFNFVYKYNGYELKLATLSYSKLVIDEIQAYSPDLLAYLISGLEEIVKHGGKFAILTATLPPFIKDYLEAGIPNTKFTKFTEGETRHHLEAIESEIDVAFIADHFESKGKKTLVICNTVKKAQEVYDSLVKQLDGVEINLIHAKFTKRDRAQKENAIKKDGETTVKKDVIWIATSIVEASLDIDFDYLFTELNDLNGFFQRLGRVNRKSTKAAMLEEPNCYLFTEINEKLLTNEKGTRGFIDRKIYQLSKGALKDYKGLITEAEKVSLIENTLTSANLQGSNFVERYQEMKNYIKTLYIGEEDLTEVQKQFRNITSYNVIPEEIYFENEDEIEANKQILKQQYQFDLMKSQEENEKFKEELELTKVKARDFINGFTISVGIYDLNKQAKYNVLNNEFPYIKCKYDEKRGFERYSIEDENDDMFP